MTEEGRTVAQEATASAGLTADQRVEGLVRLWSEAKYNFVFFARMPDLDWDAVLTEHLPLVRRDQSDQDYYRLLTRCVALLHDGHTSVWDGNGNFAVPPYLRNGPPLLVQCVEEKAVITELANTEEIGRAGLSRGMAITAVDGRSVQEILTHDLYPYVFASSPQARDGWAYPLVADGPRGTKARLEVQDLEGVTRTVTLTRELEGIKLPWEGMTEPEARELPGNIMYVPLNSFSSEETVQHFEALFDQVSTSHGLILDVRRNGGGSSAIAYSIVSYLTDKALPTSRWKTRQYRPSFRAWGRPEEWYEGDHGTIEPIKERAPFLGPLVVLIGRHTCSAAEDFLIPLHVSRRATLIGQRTNGSTGQPLTIGLPGGGNARICTKWDSYPDGREFVGVGVIPDVEINPTQREIAAGLWSDGNDPVLDKGLEVLHAQLHA